MKATTVPAPPTGGSLPSLVSLQCFVEAARRGSFPEAARAVALTPAALGQRIKALESELGVVLFVRSTRTISLTMAGLRVLPAAEAALKATRGTVSAALGEGVQTFNAALPAYYVRDDIARGDLVQVLPGIEPRHDHFRLFFRAEDPRRSIWASLAEQLRASPLK